MNPNNKRIPALDILLGVAVGDAFGVPYEFRSKSEMRENPAKKEMIGFGSHNQPIGTFSDDSSLTFCLGEALIKGYSLEETAEKFIDWKYSTYWTAHHQVFDIGMQTSRAIETLYRLLRNKSGVKKVEELPFLKYNASVTDNGNGSLMRILPFVFEIKGLPIVKQWEMVWEQSALTHGHIRAGMACMIYLKIAERLLLGESKNEAYLTTRGDIINLWNEINFAHEEREHFKRVIQGDIRTLTENQVFGSGYVIHSLEASLWCFLNTDSYENAIIAAVNLGDDTDTTAAITGGLAGLHYGHDTIPHDWVHNLARNSDIIELALKLQEKYTK